MELFKTGMTLRSGKVVIGTRTIIHGKYFPNTSILQEIYLKGKKGTIYKSFLKKDGLTKPKSIHYSLIEAGYINLYFEGDHVFDGTYSETIKEENAEDLLIKIFKESVSNKWGIGAEHIKIINGKLECIVETKFSALTFLDKFKAYNIQVEALDKNEEYKWSNPFKVSIPLEKFTQYKLH